ncbi:related to D-arabinitol 2-dehydrogenase [Fusarium torulosum]|uniref:Related to D-arabinitol 2-dehydrogenase n=1 Tax=Fusarium torulosum TaxID=33205 RepID=A0AAE8SDE2_9HYPO|nr:related to D-arabinitol 2-dehydrogenase [Fusarium torulosum]
MPRGHCSELVTCQYANFSYGPEEEQKGWEVRHDWTRSSRMKKLRTGEDTPEVSPDFLARKTNSWNMINIQAQAQQAQRISLQEQGFSLEDKAIVVSGGARGLGLVWIEALLEAGATIHAIDSLPLPVQDLESGFSQVAKRAKDLGTSLHYRRVDVRNVPALNQILEHIANGAGRLGGIIAAAGINHETPAIDYSMEETDICMIASMSATIANKGILALVYNPSKAAVVQLAHNLAMEWSKYRIRVNTLSPGYTLTQML